MAVTFSAKDGSVIAMRLTDRNGRIEPISIPAPDVSESLTPNASAQPFVPIRVTAHLRGYEQMKVEGVQIFPDITTDQEIEMIPLSVLPKTLRQSETYLTPSQNL